MIKIFGARAKDEEFELGDVEEEIQEYEQEGQVALDIIEKSDEIIIVSPIAGVDLEDIDISVKDNILTISGERRKPKEVYSKGIMIRVDECFWGPFTRDIIMPENVDLDMAKAFLEKNVLVVKIPKLKFNNQTIKIDKIDE